MVFKIWDFKTKKFEQKKREGGLLSDDDDDLDVDWCWEKEKKM